MRFKVECFYTPGYRLTQFLEKEKKVTYKGSGKRVPLGILEGAVATTVYTGRPYSHLEESFVQSDLVQESIIFT